MRIRILLFENRPPRFRQQTRNPRFCQKRVWDSGFTLLELLVSITMVSLLATAVLFGWRISASAWEKVSEQLEQNRKILATNELLMEQMASMVPMQVYTEVGQQFFFKGEEKTASFVSRYSLAHRARSGLYLIEYQIEELPGGVRALLVNERPVANSQDMLSGMIESVRVSEGQAVRYVEFENREDSLRLLDGAEELRLEYYRTGKSSEKGEWVSEWRNINNELPNAMAIRVTDKGQERTLQPVSIIAAVQQIKRPQP